MGGAIKLSSDKDAKGDKSATCKCDQLLSITAPAADLQTRSERLTQLKMDPTSRSNTFNLKKSYSYAIIRALGEGAYGMVYHARDKSSGRDVALKAMPREFTGQTDFEREVAALITAFEQEGEG